MSLYQRPLGAGMMVGLAALIIAVLVFGISAWRAEAVETAPAPAPLPVATVTADYASAASISELYPGLVAARRQSALGFERGGRIEAVLVDVGDRVEAGDVLARLDRRALDARIAAADAQTAEAEAQAAQARETEARQAQLLERGHISPQRLGEVETATRAAEARREAAAAAAMTLRVERDLAVLTAPFSGTITARHADEGVIAAPGTSVVDLVEDGALEIRIGLPQSVAAALEPGTEHIFRLPGGEVTARLRAVTGIVERETRSVTAVFDLAEGATAHAGEIARLAIDTPIGSEGFWVPVSALAEGRRGLWSVYVLVPEEAGSAYTLQARVVESLSVEAERVFVRGAVAPGERVLAAGLPRVAPGQRVRPLDAVGEAA